MTPISEVMQRCLSQALPNPTYCTTPSVPAIRSSVKAAPERQQANQAAEAEAQGEHSSWAFIKMREKLMACLGKRYANCTLDNLVVSTDKQRIVVETLREQVASDIKGFIGAGRGLMLYGPPGTGKDHLLAALLISASDAQLQARFVSGYELFEDGKDGDLFGQEMFLADRSKCHVLGISDPVISSGKALAWSREMLLRLVDIRYRRGLPTWVTLNCRGRNEAIEMLGARTFDRLRENAICLACDWPSYRTGGSH